VLLNNCTAAVLKGTYERKISISRLAIISWEFLDWGSLSADRSVSSMTWKSGGGYCNERCSPSQPGLGISREAVPLRPGALLMPMLCYPQPADRKRARAFRILQAECLYRVVNRDHRNVVNRWL